MLNFTLLVLSIVGGEPAGACQYPSTASFGHCSGILVHPHIVLSAAHCFPEELHSVSVIFGGNRATPVYAATADYCAPFPGFAPNYAPGTDWAYCWFEQPIRAIPYTPIANAADLAALETLGDFPVEAVGFGRDENDVAGQKKVAKMRTMGLANGELTITSSQGDNPCRGDSGGPVYVELPGQGWRVISTISHGPGCQDWEATTVSLGAAKWIAAETGINIALAPEVPLSLTSGAERYTCSSLPTMARASTVGNPRADWFPAGSLHPPDGSASAGCVMPNAASKTGFGSHVWLGLLLIFGLKRGATK